MKEAKVILYPTMGVSHMIPMVQLAKLFVNHGISADIAVINPPVMPASTTKFISKVSTDPNISFHLLPPLPPLPEVAPTRFTNMLHTIRSNNAELQSYLQSLSETTSIAVLILDFFCVDALDVAAELGIPAYVFYASGANALAVFISLPELVTNWDWTKKDIKETPITIPGIPLLHLSDGP